MNIRELGLSSEFADRLEAKGIVEPTGIQAEVFAPILEGNSAVGYSKTGTGKTFAYMLPLVERLSRVLKEGEGAESAEGPSEGMGARVLVLVPTRELAAQVARDVDLVAGHTQKHVVVVGGESEDQQIQSGKVADWLIATPGRMLDLLKRRVIGVSRIKAVVFDEADRLLDMGFVDDMRAIMRLLPPNLQLLFFSATIHFGVDEMAYEFGSSEILRFGKETDELTVEGLDHRVSFVGDDEKFHALVHFISAKEGQRGIVFSNYRDKAHDIASGLRRLRCRAEVLTAQLSQPQRTRIMERFRKGDTQVLVASDLAARGLDVFDIDFVVNFDLPEDPATYVHRVGRTARAGRQGQAVSLVGFEDSFRLEKTEKFLGKSIERFQFEIQQLQGPLPRFKEGPEPFPEELEGEEPRRQRFAPDARHERQRGPRQPRQDRQPRQHDREGRNNHQPRRQQQAPQAPRQERAVAHMAPQKPGFWGRLWRGLKGVFGLKHPVAVATEGAKAQGSGVVAGAARRSPGAVSGGRGRGGRGNSHRGGSRSGGPRRGRSSSGGGRPPRSSRPPSGSSGGGRS